MTIRTTFTPAASRGLVLSALMVSLSGCGMLGSVIESDKLDYRAAKKAAPLDVPPDLTQLQKDNRYAVPDGRGVATASTYQQQNSGASGVTTTPGKAAASAPMAVGANANAAIKVERNGNQRWLIVRQSPEQLWPQLQQFWHDAGFTLATESASTGVMETEWAENRSKIPQDVVRRSLGKMFEGAYSTGERDKYRTRLERAADGSTEIYISHRGAEEVLTGAQKEGVQWVGRANDPGLESQFLAKLMARLGGVADVKAAESAVDNAVVQPAHAKLVSAAGASYVEVDEGFDRAWRRVGLALDRVGFTVEDRDRVNGVYFVRYIDPDAVGTTGFLQKLLTFGAAADKEKEAQRYRVSVKASSGASASLVTVQKNDGMPETGATGAKILKLLGDELK